MKIIVLLTLLIHISCIDKIDNSLDQSSQSIELDKNQDSLFTLKMNKQTNSVKITASKELQFSLPDSSTTPTPYKFADFNTDGKKDVMIYLGACGTGGCLYGLFLNQHDNNYKLVFLDYLKNIEFDTDKNNCLFFKSSEEIEAYNPSKLQVSIFKFDQNKYYYELDTIFIYYR